MIRFAARTALVFGLCAATASLSAHRLDEYLQATRIGIDGGRVDLEIDLTPGVAVADQVFGWIDTDRDGRVSPAEGDAYARVVLDAVSLDVDDRRQPLTLSSRRFPSLDEMRQGVGTIQLIATAPTSSIVGGRHRIVYRNSHRPEISVYLVNALAPKDPGAEVLGQQRDVRQHELTLDYRLAGSPWAPLASWPFVASFGMATVLLAIVWRGRRRLGF